MLCVYVTALPVKKQNMLVLNCGSFLLQQKVPITSEKPFQNETCYVTSVTLTEL